MNIEGVSCLSSNGNMICFANESQYQLMNIMNKSVTPLFAFDPLIGSPFTLALTDPPGFLVVLGTSPGNEKTLI